ncbi:MAG: phosphomethylpyrimidine synthase ThiC [Elusimicrobiota bacterium]
MTYKELAKDYRITAEMEAVAEAEGLSPKVVREGVASGSIVILKNKNRTADKICGVGRKLRTKVNANLGSSPASISLKAEEEKLDAALRAGADAVMDLSTGGDLNQIRKMVLEKCTVPVGTVPIYQVACETVLKGKNIWQMDKEHIFSVIEQQAAEGVDFVTVHCGITRRSLAVLEKNKRLTGIVSRGGAFLSQWVLAKDQENPLYEEFDRLVSIAKKYDLTLSLGDALRPGSLSDSSDAAQLAELSILGELTELAWKEGVQVIIEGPGHLPLNEIVANVLLEKQICKNAPFYLLGPLVTDVAPGYDHITSAIGAAIAASAGADFICYVTPAEHIRLPDAEDVYTGVISARIAAHAADIAKGVHRARVWDHDISQARKELNWEMMEKLAISPEEFRKQRAKSPPLKDKEVCTMCGQFCAMRKVNKFEVLDKQTSNK